MTNQKDDVKNLELSDNAMDFLGLSQQPFSAPILSADAIFSDATLEQLIDTTKHHLQFSDLLLILEGDSGSGKTTLFRQLLQGKAENLFLISLPASATFTLAQIQQTISTHLEDQGDANYLDENLKRLQIFDQTPVLIIDDAHVLADTTIQELLRYQKQLESEHEVKLKILMFANKGMAKTITTISSLQHNQLYVQEMPSYTAEQIHGLLLQRLSSVNYQGKDYFSDDITQRIAKKSDGLPIKIMQQAVTQLENITKRQNRPAFIPKKPTTLFASLALIAFFAIAVFYFLPAEKSIEENDLTSTELNTETTFMADKTPTTETSFTEEPLTEMNSSTNTDIAELEAIDEPIDTETINDRQIYIEEEPILAENNNAVTEEPVPADITEQIEPTIIAAAEEELIKPEPVIEPKIESKPAPLNNYLAKLNSLGLHDPNWVMQHDKSHWTLQIMGARLPISLYKFSKLHKLNQNSSWFKTELSGKPWYILVYGLYTNKDTARQALQNLPGGLKKSKPWIKNIGAIQKSIKP